MEKLYKSLVLLFTVGGGSVGFVLIFSALVSWRDSYGAPIVSILFLITFAYLIFSGLAFVLSQNTYHAAVALSLQVPWISSGLISYKLASFFNLSILFKIDGVSFQAMLGSRYYFDLLSNSSLGVGVNIGALAMLILFYKVSIRK